MQAARLGRDRHLGAELLRLRVGATHQRHAGDAGREAEIVLDPGRGAGLAAEGAAVENQRGKPFRSGVDRGREPGRPRSHDRHVIDAIRIDRPDKPDAAGKLGLARIAQQLPVRTQHDRQLSRIDMEALDQRLRLGVVLGIKPQMRMTIAAEEAFEPEHVAVLGPTDDHRSAAAGLDQADAPQDKRAHDALAELRLRDQERTQAIRCDDQGLDRALRVRVDQRGPAGELRQLAHERARLVGDDQLAAAELAVLGDVDLAGQDDHQPVADLADARERIARRVGADLAEPAHALDLMRLQCRKHLGAPRVDNGLRQWSHDCVEVCIIA